MGAYIITGGEKLRGAVRIGGGKNAVLPILAACMLNAGVCVLHNCPRISDTQTALAILRALGCAADFDGDEIVADSAFADEYRVPEAQVLKMRAAIIFLGSVLGRFGKVRVCFPGGCELGARPIDLHLKAMRQMGAVITEDGGCIDCTAARLRGARIHLDFPSVGATENVMLAAVLAEGETVITNAAREPEIVDLQGFLNAMGADVRGAGSGTVVISGVLPETLHSVEYTIMPDRIVAGTMLTAAAITHGEIVLDGVVPEHLSSVLAKLAETGCEIREFDRQIELRAPERIRAIDCVRTLPHPGFPTDMQSQLMAYLCVADGTSVCIETVFESRNKHVAALTRMGAEIILSQDGQTSVIKGVPKLCGARVAARDLRGGAALVLAGLAAEGETVVTETKHIERGYERLTEDLVMLGADIAVADA